MPLPAPSRIVNELGRRLVQLLAALGVATLSLAATAADDDASTLLTRQTGTLPLVISAPHGGNQGVSGVPRRAGGTHVRDANTYELALAVQRQLLARTGQQAHLVVARAARPYVDFNRQASEAYESAVAEPVYQAYHAALQAARAAAWQRASACAMVLDVHGQATSADTVYRGTRNGGTAQLAPLYEKGDFFDGLRAKGITVEPDDATAGKEHPNYNGGFIVATYGRRGEPALDAVQLEFGARYRANGALDATADALAQALVQHLAQRCPEVLK